MENKRTGRRTGAGGVKWYSPLVIWGAGISGIGLPLVPALSVYYDGRGGWLGLGALAVLCLGLYALLGPAFFPLIVFLLICTSTPYVCCKLKTTFYTGFAYSVLGGILGAVASLALLNLLLGGQPAIVWGQMAANKYLQAASGGDWAQAFTVSLGDATLEGRLLADSGQYSPDGMLQIMNQVAAMDPVIKAQQLQELFTANLSMTLPAIMLCIGLGMGALTWYLPVYFLQRSGQLVIGAKDGVKVPHLADANLPRWLLNSTVAAALLLWLAQLFGMEGIGAVSYATSTLVSLLFGLQGMTLAAFLMRRWKWPAIVSVIVMIIILMPPISAIYFFAGLVESIFHIRLGLTRIDELRARGIDPSSTQAMVELQRMELKRREEERRRNQKKNDDDDDDGEV